METTRRDFLKMSGTGALILSTSPFLGACAGFTPTHSARGGIQEALVLGLEDGMAEILTYASLAPSGHNMQPWRVRRIGPYEYAIGIDSSRLLPAVDPENRETMLSIGAFVENLCSAASALGFESSVQVTGTGAPDEDLVKVSLAKTIATDFPIHRITTRRTVKRGYLPKPLSADHVRALADVWPGHIFHFDRGSSHATCLADWTAEAYSHQTFRDDAQRELAACIRFDRKDAMKYRYGLTTEGMEITGIAGWYVRTFMGAGDVMSTSFRKQGIDIYAAQAKEGAGWIIIMSEGSTAADLVETGRRFERMALMVRDMGMAIHPMTQILEEQQWRDRYASLHVSAMTPQFILRVGYLRSYPEPVSLRRPVKWFLEM